MSYFIFIHISPYLFHSDAWPLSHFLIVTHICLVLLSIKKYLFLFWVMYYHLAEFFFFSFFPCHLREYPFYVAFIPRLLELYVYYLLWHGSWLIVQNVHCVWRNLNGPNEDFEKTRRRNSRLQLALAVTLWWKVQYSILQSMQAKNCGTLFTV